MGLLHRITLIREYSSCSDRSALKAFHRFSTRDTLQDTARLQFEHNKKSRRMVFAQAAARGSEWGGGPVLDRAPVRSKDFESVAARMRSGSGGSRTTTTSDSGDFDITGATPNMTTSLSSLSSSASHHPRQPPQFLHSPPQRLDNISSTSSNGTLSLPSPGPPQSLSLNPAPQTSLSPIVNRMRERDADEMEKYMRRNRSGSAGTSSTDNRSQAGPNFSSAGPSGSGDELDSISSLGIAGTTAPRRLLRPSFSAAQLRSSPSPIPAQPTQTDASRHRAGTNPNSARPVQPCLSPPPIASRTSSSDCPRYEETLVEEPEIYYMGPPTQYAHFPEPPRKSNRSASSSAAAAITRRLPFNLLSKPTPPPPEHGHNGHRRGSSTTSIRS